MLTQTAKDFNFYRYPSTLCWLQPEFWALIWPLAALIVRSKQHHCPAAKAGCWTHVSKHSLWWRPTHIIFLFCHVMLREHIYASHGIQHLCPTCVLHAMMFQCLKRTAWSTWSYSLHPWTMQSWKCQGLLAAGLTAICYGTKEEKKMLRIKLF